MQTCGLALMWLVDSKQFAALVNHHASDRLAHSDEDHKLYIVILSHHYSNDQYTQIQCIRTGRNTHLF